MGIEALTGIDLIILLVVALVAGLLDASVGSGGAVLLPALIGASPAGVSGSVPLAVNKPIAVIGNLIAAHRYRTPGRGLGVKPLAVTCGSALAGVLCGVWIATLIDVRQLTWIAAAALSALVVTLLIRGLRRRPTIAGPMHARPQAVPLAVGGIAVYDGMIGPATGGLLQLTFQRLLGRPAHECLALARLVQALLNLTAAIVLCGSSRPPTSGSSRRSPHYTRSAVGPGQSSPAAFLQPCCTTCSSVASPLPSCACSSRYNPRTQLHG